MFRKLQSLSERDPNKVKEVLEKALKSDELEKQVVLQNQKIELLSKQVKSQEQQIKDLTEKYTKRDEQTKGLLAKTKDLKSEVALKTKELAAVLEITRKIPCKHGQTCTFFQQNRCVYKHNAD